MAKLVVDEMELKASIYDYVMSHIMDKDFENIAAVAEDIRKIVINIAKTPSDDYETIAERIKAGEPINLNYK